MEAEIKSFVELAFDRNVMLISGGVFTAIRALQKTELSKVAVYRRVLPILPETIGVVAVVAGGVPLAAAFPLALKVALGLWCGYVAQKFHKLIGQTILGDDRQIEKAQVTTNEEEAGP